jgi:hypothetical protein
MEWRDGIAFIPSAAAKKLIGEKAYALLCAHEVYKNGPFPDTFYLKSVETIMVENQREYDFVSDEAGYRFVPIT